jgi:hypothetical protein
MGKIKKRVLFLCLPLFILMLISCSNNRALNLKDDKGDFSKSASKILTSKYEIKSTDDFFSRIDFDLKEGKVDWEITNPKGEVVFKGYAINENGTTYRQLIYPQNYLNGGDLNQKQEVKSDIDGDGNIRIVPDFSNLYFMDVRSLGVYTLSLTPTNAEGKYTIMWSNGIVKK